MNVSRETSADQHINVTNRKPVVYRQINAVSDQPGGTANQTVNIPGRDKHMRIASAAEKLRINYRGHADTNNRNTQVIQTQFLPVVANPGAGSHTGTVYLYGPAETVRIRPGQSVHGDDKRRLEQSTEALDTQRTFNTGGPKHTGTAKGERMEGRKNRVAGMLQMAGHDKVGGG